MNVIISNKYQTMLQGLDIDIIKSVTGEFDVEEIIGTFDNFFFQRMILDITAIRGYKDVKTIQKLSIAYDVVGNQQNRLIYDILSLVYNKENYPDIEAIAPYSDDDEGVDVCVVDLTEVISKIIGYKRAQKYKIATYKTALKLNAKVSLVNWLAGWWHHKGMFLNIKAIVHNFKNPVSKHETLKIMLHNMVAYAKKSQHVLSVKCAIKAKSMLAEQDKKLVDEFISGFNVRASAPKNGMSIL